MTNRVDVLVVGGGPIGLAAAIEARLRGLTVTVIEPRTAAIDKACGEGLMPGAMPALARLGIDPPGYPLRGISYRDATRQVDHRFARGEGRGVRRTALHAALAARADELGVRRAGGRVDALEQNGDEVVAGGIHSRYLLAADGLHSRVRRMVGLELPAQGAKRFGLRQHFEIAATNDLIEVHWGRGFEAYVTPVSPTVVGVAVLGPPGTNFSAAVNSIPSLAARLAGATAASELRGAGPLRQRTRGRTAGRVMLVGDASGYVDAITGEGIRVGLAQAQAAIDCIVAGRASRYDARWRAATRDFRMLTGGLVAAATSPLRAGIVPAAAHLPNVFGAVVERLAR